MTAAALLLAVDAVELYPPAAGADAHGFEQPGADPYWVGVGNLQEQPGTSDPRMEGGGGGGPYSPSRVESCRLFLPADAQPAEGSAALVRGRWWALSQVRLVPDPTAPAGGISCWTATATSTAQWSGG